MEDMEKGDIVRLDHNVENHDVAEEGHCNVKKSYVAEGRHHKQYEK